MQHSVCWQSVCLLQLQQQPEGTLCFASGPTSTGLTEKGVGNRVWVDGCGCVCSIAVSCLVM